MTALRHSGMEVHCSVIDAIQPGVLFQESRRQFRAGLPSYVDGLSFED